MPAAYSNIVVKDGNGNNISGGVAALDQSGSGIGPWNFANILVDGVSGSNRASVNASGQLLVSAALATGTASIGTVTLATGSATVGGVFLVTGSAVIGSLATGTAVIGSLATGTNSIGTVQPGNTQNSTPWVVTVAADVTGGGSVFSLLVLTGSNAQNIKSSAGKVLGWSVTNNSANIGYIKLYDTAGTPTTGSGTPKIRIMVPGNASGAGNNITLEAGVAFASGIGMTTTSGWLDSDTSAVATGAFILNLFYK